MTIFSSGIWDQGQSNENQTPLPEPTGTPRSKESNDDQRERKGRWQSEDRQPKCIQVTMDSTVSSIEPFIPNALMCHEPIKMHQTPKPPFPYKPTTPSNPPALTEYDKKQIEKKREEIRRGGWNDPVNILDILRKI